MSRYTGPKLKVIRRLGSLPALTRKRCRRRSRPGQHGPARKNRFRETKQYTVRLEEKQKLRFNYGIGERQLVNYMKKAKRMRGSTGTILLQFLEMRLDNIVFRLKMAPTILASRQLVSHKHILINNKCVSIPSYQCKPGDVVSIKGSKVLSMVRSNASIVTPGRGTSPGSRRGLRIGLPRAKHLLFDEKRLTGKVLSVVSRSWVSIRINELFVIEFYSRKI
jgi:small subunit ribosomal protein S4